MASFGDMIIKTIEHGRGYRWGRGWSTKFIGYPEDGEANKIHLLHYGTRILSFTDIGRKILFFRLGSVSDNRAINRTLSEINYDGWAWPRRGQFSEKICGHHINTCETIRYQRGNDIKGHVVMIDDDAVCINERRGLINTRDGKFFQLKLGGYYQGFLLFRVMSRKKEPFKGNKALSYWTLADEEKKSLAKIFPIVSDRHGNVYRATVNADFPEDFINKCVAKVV